jgi:hypothetical protein
LTSIYLKQTELVSCFNKITGEYMKKMILLAALTIMSTSAFAKGNYSCTLSLNGEVVTENQETKMDDWTFSNAKMKSGKKIKTEIAILEDKDTNKFRMTRSAILNTSDEDGSNAASVIMHKIDRDAKTFELSVSINNEALELECHR